ncbi:unnamed protein product [Acanthoscelides obtectus]|uniref:Uncharacterized protein n=1 Tax=Acanthoscelides obtectus TaxID=200917 RepID=A0A9P0NQR1_ACAOB|nr:unnamed protein product [Acanthoscelides obtectus]CAK1655001.1 hypothetical protein AOBTE_LOCUS18953 [Acanthoscelides obtectus]
MHGFPSSNVCSRRLPKLVKQKINQSRCFCRGVNILQSSAMDKGMYLNLGLILGQL